ncbi:sugar transferase [Sulfitobacter aestuarii]|uniref:Sugar transferase n=1 Tax=Sulfitobacter aestuarii TaxID=2161676 RepID=A0ABW5U1V6_9RHOB
MAHLDRPFAAADLARPGTGFYAGHGKRLLDLTLVLATLPMTLPLIALLWLLVRGGGGPGFYGHRRIGRHGKAFTCWKIRSMHEDSKARLAALLAQDRRAADDWAARAKLGRDPRITRLGRFLRRSSLDELPQLWNVLRGEMSLVGPRPVTAAELARYGEHLPRYLGQRPGLTGLWQVSARERGCYAVRVRLDSAYCAQISARRDLKVLLATFGAVLRGTGS